MAAWRHIDFLFKKCNLELAGNYLEGTKMEFDSGFGNDFYQALDLDAIEKEASNPKRKENSQQKKENQMWRCSACTLMNHVSNLRCKACRTPAPQTVQSQGIFSILDRRPRGYRGYNRFGMSVIT